MSFSDLELSAEGELSLDDCDALLRFPYHQYVEVKEEPDLPELGTNAHLSLEGNNEDISEIEIFASPLLKEDEVQHDPEEIQQCLKENKSCQYKIIQLLEKLDQALIKNRENKARAAQLIKSYELAKAKCKNFKPIQLFAAPYFRDGKGKTAPDNVDTIQKMKNKDFTAFDRPPKAWTVEEKDKLSEGVGASALSYILKPFKAKRDHLKSKMKHKDATDEDIARLKKEVVAVEKQMRAHCERQFQDLVEEAGDNIDWMVISATNMEGTRSEMECEVLWKNYLSPFVNKEPFTKEEDQKIKTLALQHKDRNWPAIAEELGTNRSVIQVFERYQLKLNQKLCHSFWTKEEDDKLLELVEKHKTGKFINWNAIDLKMEGRTRYQIINRYERTLYPDIKRVPWTPEEDAMLYACVYKFSNKWTNMQEFFTGRTVYSVRERFVNTLDPDLKLGCWKKEEDEELIRLVKLHGYGKWSQISRHLHGRTDNMCFTRARRLVNYSIQKSGNDDIDWNCNEVHKLVKNLKPAVATKMCRKQNNRLRNTQAKAREVLEDAMTKVAPQLEEKFDDLAKFNYATLSLRSLRLLYKELASRIQAPSEPNPKYVPKYFPYTKGMRHKRANRTTKKRPRIEYEDEEEDADDPGGWLVEDDSETEDEEEEVVVDTRLNEVDQVWLKRALDSQFDEEAECLYSTVSSKKPIHFSRKDSIEIALYLKYLRKFLGCLDTEPDPVDPRVDENYLGSFDTIVNLFISPHQFVRREIILPPNFSTLLGIDTLRTVEQRLRKSGSTVDHSMQYISYATGFNEVKPLCVACSVKNHNASPVKHTLEEALNVMKSNFIAVTERTRREAMIETRTIPDGQQIACRCKELADSKTAVETLSRRFLAMFLWPYLCDRVGFSEQQEMSIYKECRPTRSVSPERKSPTKRSRRKSFGIKRVKSPKKDWQPNVKFEFPQAAATRRSPRAGHRNRKFSQEIKDNEEEEST